MKLLVMPPVFTWFVSFVRSFVRLLACLFVCFGFGWLVGLPHHFLWILCLLGVPYTVSDLPCLSVDFFPVLSSTFLSEILLLSLGITNMVRKGRSIFKKLQG